jgi:hypothetical protein
MATSFSAHVESAVKRLAGHGPNVVAVAVTSDPTAVQWELSRRRCLTTGSQQLSRRMFPAGYNHDTGVRQDEALSRLLWGRMKPSQWGHSALTYSEGPQEQPHQHVIRLHVAVAPPKVNPLMGAYEWAPTERTTARLKDAPFGTRTSRQIRASVAALNAADPGACNASSAATAESQVRPSFDG